MRSGTWAWMLVAATGCGRVGFDPSRDAASDASPDTSRQLDAPPSLCAGSSALLCDGFESATLDARWLLDVEQGRARPSLGQPYRGAYSLHVDTDTITTPTLYPRASVYSYDGLPVTGTLHARVFVWLQMPASTAFDQFLNFANGNGEGISMGIRNGFVVANDYTALDFAESATVAFPSDRWACVQFEIPSGIPGTTRVFIDGAEVTDVRLTKATVQPAPTHIYVGIDWPNMYSSLPGSAAWFDELIVDDAPTSCAD